MGSGLIFRGHEADQQVADTYSPKPPKPWASVTRPIQYLLREQRLVFILVGIAIATVVFTLLPSSAPISPYATGNVPISNEYVRYDFDSSATAHYKPAYDRRFGLNSWNSGGKVPLGLKRKGLRIVVTGGAGFVGSHLVDRLIERGDSVIVVDNFFTGRKENVMHHFGNPRFELIRHDVVEPLLLEVDQIYHLACPASPVHYKFNPVKTIKTNVVGTLNMLGLAKRIGARFLLTSTSEVYGDPLQHPQVETYWGNVNPIGVRSCYDEGKRTAETLTMDYHRGAGVEVRIARIFNTYGPRMCIDDGRVVSNFVAQALRKEPMTVYGDGKQTRSFQYVSDLVEGLMRLMEGEHVGPFNLGNPGEFTMLELAKVVQETIDPAAKIEYRPNTEDDPHKRKPDITKAKDLLGWQPKVSLQKGLPLMVSDFRKRIFGDHKEGGATTAL
ncbi:UDP-glucuronic acid decarboxylase 2-like [Pyrus ussuriensis x Pyrus communis]|uniref:UDP-glucuronate decarboxylase n=1 Tax=Pyrus ussuriensis x Pyrus communis TaxID=2448454 RepID=A0A5N5GL18_9ROSA|nr:UDP-glucuronic acid decarboxylase 2 [Pyrus x bretschneideri]KAB2616266.1 UDP-glucuronic acid decarboxylase 2-like [Pyrus ussuriensis x Pyrus communis]